MSDEDSEEQIKKSLAPCVNILFTKYTNALNE